MLIKTSILIVALIVTLAIFALVTWTVKRNTRMETEKAMCLFKVFLYGCVAVFTVASMVLGEEEVTILSTSIVMVSLAEVYTNFCEFKKRDGK